MKSGVSKHEFDVKKHWNRLHKPAVKNIRLTKTISASILTVSFSSSASSSEPFIFGNAAVVLQDCDIHARRPNSGQKNMLTAQGRTDPNQNTGIVIQRCRIGATSDLQPVRSSFPTYLVGRGKSIHKQ
ncbi:hypothetical protein DY000_02043116 [Brassica cretica]|uniref:Pectinesterase catalytic domain-containing protein n=1 Tax=Brassica cretica TaxID=69181 RepID=A0ABQ7B6H7_BRACR|nr:hypothetical protein DY000_02043116 [Brassica cretica]